MLQLRRLLPSTCAVAQASAEGMQLLLPSLDVCGRASPDWGKATATATGAQGRPRHLLGMVLCYLSESNLVLRVPVQYELTPSPLMCSYPR